MVFCAWIFWMVLTCSRLLTRGGRRAGIRRSTRHPQGIPLGPGKSLENAHYKDTFGRPVSPDWNLLALLVLQSWHIQKNLISFLFICTLFFFTLPLLYFPSASSISRNWLVQHQHRGCLELMSRKLRKWEFQFSFLPTSYSGICCARSRKYSNIQYQMIMFRLVLKYSMQNMKIFSNMLRIITCLVFLWKAPGALLPAVLLSTDRWKDFELTFLLLFQKSWLKAL